MCSSDLVEDNSPIAAGGSVTRESLGIETLGGVFTPLIKQDTATPCLLTEVFSTASDSQSQILLNLFRGTNQMATNNHALGRFEIVGIPPAPRGVPQIEVKFSVTQTQILLSAREVNRGVNMTIRRVETSGKATSNR